MEQNTLRTLGMLISVFAICFSCFLGTHFSENGARNQETISLILGHFLVETQQNLYLICNVVLAATSYHGDILL